MGRSVGVVFGTIHGYHSPSYGPIPPLPEGLSNLRSSSLNSRSVVNIISYYLPRSEHTVYENLVFHPVDWVDEVIILVPGPRHRVRTLGP